jgi:GH15 family glucan-1,4-alpha-glucosidase
MTNRPVPAPDRTASIGAVRETAARIHVLPDYTVRVGGARDESGYVSISDYAFLSDCRSAALVASDGSVDWLCWPRFDSSALFGRVLDSGCGGRFVFAPTHAYSVERRYVERTNVLQTTFRTASGAVRLDDWLHTGARQALCRLATCLDGEVELELLCDPRPEYGATHKVTWESRLAWLVSRLPSGDELFLDGLRSPRERFTLRAGDHRGVSLGWNRPGPSDLFDSRARAITFWQDWARDLVLPDDRSEHVLRAALALKGLQYQPTGAIVAAPTTSLPEEIGGVRNWDYRYSWLRDSSFTLYALGAVGKLGEAQSWLDYVSMISARANTADLQIVYGVDGEADLTEMNLAHLEGYRGSAPVRIGNGAAKQRQLDTYGELCDSIWLLRRKTRKPLSPHRWAIVKSLADRAAAEWKDPDTGIWEVRGEPRHFVHSKVWCWAALDRALMLARKDGLTDAPLDHWRRTRDAIKADVLARGWDEELGTFTQSYGSRSLDASNLLLAQVGFIAPHDPRFVSTVRAIQRDLRRGPFVDRYRVERTDDGLAGGEGTFTICTLWLVLALTQIGAVDEAEELFTQVLARASDLGLLSEELSPEGEQLGNFPQGFAHIGVIACAFALEGAHAKARRASMRQRSALRPTGT